MASKVISHALVNELKTVTVPEVLRKRDTPYPFSLESSNFGKLAPKLVYTKILNKEFLLAAPELSKTAKVKVAKMWRNGFLLLVEKKEDDYYFTGYTIHHLMTGTDYCGKLYYKTRTSDVAKHLRKCLTGSVVKPGGPKPNQSQSVLPFTPTKTAELNSNDLSKVNLALKQWIYANCRPYNIANDQLFTDFINSILEVGAKYGKMYCYSLSIKTYSLSKSIINNY